MKKVKDAIGKFFFGNWWLPATIVSLFLCLISFFQVNSAFADKHNINGVWIVLGSIFAISTLYCGRKAAKTAPGQGG